MLTKSLIVLVLLGIHFQTEARCPASLPSRQNLKLSEYMGTWYMIKAGPAYIGNPTTECMEESYTQNSNYLNILDYQYKRRRSGNWQTGNGLGVVKDLEFPGVLDVYESEGPLHQSLLATDGVQWAIWYACEEDPNNNENSAHIYMLWSRTRTITSETEQILTAIIDGYGLKPEDMMHMNQTNCV